MRPSVLSPPGTDPALRRCDCFRGIDCKGPAPGPCACVRRSRGRVPASHGRHPDVVLLGLRNGWARHQDACRTPAPGGTDRTPAASRIVTSPLPEPAAARERRAVSVAGGKMTPCRRVNIDPLTYSPGSIERGEEGVAVSGGLG